MVGLPKGPCLELQAFISHCHLQTRKEKMGLWSHFAWQLLQWKDLSRSSTACRRTSQFISAQTTSKFCCIFPISWFAYSFFSKAKLLIFATYVLRWKWYIYDECWWKGKKKKGEWIISTIIIYICMFVWDFLHQKLSKVFTFSVNLARASTINH